MATRAKKRSGPPGRDGTSPTPLAVDLWTDEQREAFLTLIAQGIGPHLAASQTLNATATAVRRMVKRDEAFGALYESAREEGRLYYIERLQAEARKRALDGSEKMLEVELGTYDPEHRHLRRDRVRHEGTVAHEHALVIDVRSLDGLPLEKLQAYREMLLELQAAQTVDGEGHELPPAA